ncbi:hypothetical protein [Flagellimonas nanhaiensis]|uniref:Prenyltransferase n=1 Tax=Flagellimonas nanhaiensis TaxID=2292706 RepID=A0A371JS58_9FLAO|nr:hypothetical protein [Allomuricauda nanhaiensis]RDY60651.1 hypothetical protein DX873_00270 [Allomuricauda nanhaiensis]
MRTLKFIFDFYLDASIHVALAVISLMGCTFYFLNISWNLSLMGFVFFSTVVCYNFIKYGVEAYKYIIVSNSYHKGIQVFSFLSFGLAMYFFVQLNTSIWIAVVVLGLLSTLYAVPLLPDAKNLRNLAGFKVYIVALVWTGFTVLLPVLDVDYSIGWDIGVLMAQRFILVLVLLLPFEIRDLKWDDQNLRTLPQVLGVKKTIGLGLGLTMLFFTLTFLKDEITTMEIWTRLVLGILLISVLLVNQKKRGGYFVSFWVEGIPIIWLAVLRMASNF